jgi:hypothetical protein
MQVRRCAVDDLERADRVVAIRLDLQSVVALRVRNGGFRNGQCARAAEGPVLFGFEDPEAARCTDR